MKHNLILIRTLRADNTASPEAEVIAKLCEAVLTVPGLRVKSVEVSDVSDTEVVVRRIREVKAKRKGEALPDIR